MSREKVASSDPTSARDLKLQSIGFSVDTLIEVGLACTPSISYSFLSSCDVTFHLPPLSRVLVLGQYVLRRRARQGDPHRSTPMLLRLSRVVADLR